MNKPARRTNANTVPIPTRPPASPVRRQGAASTTQRPSQRTARNAQPQRPLTEEERRRRAELREQRRLENIRKAREKKERRNRIILFALVLFALIVAVLLIAKAVSGGKTEAKPEKNDVQTEAVTESAEPEAHLPAITYPTPATDMAALEIDCEYGTLVRLSDNAIIADKGGSQKIFPASMTKIMTLVVAVENVPDVEKTTYTFTAELLAPFLAENATVAGFRAGENVSVKDMLYGLILPSGADAAEGLALCVSGSVQAFAEKMNETAQRIGMTGTHFMNPSGLHNDNQYTTCLDMAVLLEYAMKNPICAEVLSTYQYTTAETEQNPTGIALTSTLFSRLEGGEPGTSRVFAGKTGYTTEAGNCLASYAKSNADGSEYILVTAKGNTIWKPIFDSINTYKLYIK